MHNVYSATLLANGMVLVVGEKPGIDHEVDELPPLRAELYNPVTGKFTPTGGMTEITSAHTATLLKNGKVLFIGWVSGVELYDPVAGKFSRVGKLTTPRQMHTATLLPNGKVLVIGGKEAANYGLLALTSAELYDPVTNLFAPTGSLVRERVGHTATLLANGKVLVVGWSEGAELYDPNTGKFSLTGKPSVVRIDHTATLLKNGNVLVTGGFTTGYHIFDSAELYDPAAGTFSASTAMNSSKQSAAP
jgi:hypothetical protein